MDVNLYSKNLDECCRTCMGDKFEEMYDIFAAGSDSNIAEIMSLHTSIKVITRYLSKEYVRIVINL